MSLPAPSTVLQPTIATAARVAEVKSAAARRSRMAVDYDALGPRVSFTLSLLGGVRSVGLNTTEFRLPLSWSTGDGVFASFPP